MVGARMLEADGHAGRLGKDRSFHPLWPRIDGIGTGLAAAPGRLAEGAITGQEGPVDAERLVVVHKPPAPDLMEDPGLLPFWKRR